MHWSEHDTPEPERIPEPQGALVPPRRRPPTAAGAAEDDPAPARSPQWRPRHSPWVAGSDAPDAPTWLRELGQAFDWWLGTHGGAVRLYPRRDDEKDTRGESDDRAA